MSLTGHLIGMMKNADSPRAIRAISRALEFTTGISRKEILGTFSTVTAGDWYKENGYKLLGGSFLGGAQSYSGQVVSMDTALQSAAFLSGVKVISEDIGSLPFFLYRRSADGKSTERANDIPLYSVLHDLWNPEVSAGEGVEALTAHALMTGHGFAYILRVDGKVLRLYPWQPHEVKLGRDRQTGNLAYEHLENGQWKPYSRSDVLHLKGFTLTGYDGDSLLDRARHVIGLTLSTQEYPARWFSQGSMLDVVLERPAEKPALSPDAVKLLKQAWVAWHQGLGANSFEPAVLQEGMKATILTPKHSDTQLIEQRKFQVLEVCRLLRLPPHKLCDLEKNSYSSIEAENIAYRTNTLMPWNRRWAEAVHRCLLSPAEQIEGRLYAEQSVEALMRGDFSTQAQAFRAFLEKGVYTINEVRRWLNLNPVDGGDENRVQLNTSPVSEAAQQLADEARKQAPEKKPNIHVVRDDKQRIVALQYGDPPPSHWEITANGVTTACVDRDANGRIVGVKRHGS